MGPEQTAGFSNSSAWTFLRRDPILIAAAFVFLFTGVAYLIPGFSRHDLVFFADYVVDPVLLLLAIAGVRLGFVGIQHREERRFWNWVTVALLSWLAVTAVSRAWQDVWSPTVVAVLIDSLYAAYYMGLALACESKPHLRSGWSRKDVTHRLESAGVVLCVLGLFLYFVLIPSTHNPDAYATYVPSMVLFMGLDLFLGLRFSYFAATCSLRRWQVLYGLLAATILLSGLDDAHELYTYLQGRELARGTLWEFLWYPQFVGMLLAVRFQAQPPRSQDSPPRAEEAELLDLRRTGAGAILFYAFLLPVFHACAFFVAPRDPLSLFPRAVLLLAYLVVFGSLAFVNHVVLVRKNRSLRTDLNAARERLFIANKMEALGRLAGGVAHDFNNLLGVVIGYCDLLSERVARDDTSRRYTQQIREAGEHAAALTQQLLAISRKQMLHTQVFEFDALVGSLEEPLRRTLGQPVRLHLALRALGGRVKGDPAQFELVLLNLAENARDSMPLGGDFSIETDTIEIDADHVFQFFGLIAGPHLRVVLRDSGKGLDADTLSHLFEPFFNATPDAKGAGMGLATVYGIVRQSAGHIDVSSEPGRGTTVTIYLPQVVERAKLLPQTQPAGQPLRGSETILLAEDEDALRRLTTEFLSSIGYRVLEAANGPRALQLAEQLKQDIHLLLTDVVMPGMSGRELADRLTAQRPGLKVLFISGYTGREVFPPDARGREPAFLQKPFSLDALARKVREVLEQRAVV